MLVWLLEQLSSTLHNSHTQLGLADFIERVVLGATRRREAAIETSLFVYRYGDTVERLRQGRGEFCCESRPDPDAAQGVAR